MNGEKREKKRRRKNERNGENGKIQGKRKETQEIKGKEIEEI